MTDAQLISTLERRLHIAKIHLHLLEREWQELQDDIAVFEEITKSALDWLLKSAEAPPPLPRPPPLPTMRRDRLEGSM